MQERLKTKTSHDTDLVIATTGHGDQVGDAGTLCLQDGCDGDTVVSILDTIPFAKRFVYMDQCYSGNWNKIFLNDPKTLFVSAGSKNEQDVCQEIAPLFWGGGCSRCQPRRGDQLAGALCLCVWSCDHFFAAVCAERGISFGGTTCLLEKRNNLEVRLERKIVAAEKIQDDQNRSYAFRAIASGLAQAGLKGRVQLPL